MIFRILIFLLICEVSSAQYATPLNFHNKLSQNTVIAMAQDDSGFLWLGTADGLNRFDGINIETYRHNREDNNTICGNVITDLKCDAFHNMWIATSSGLSRLSLETYSFYNFNGDSIALSGLYISEIEIIDNVVFALSRTGLYLIDIESSSLLSSRQFNGMEIENITKYEEDGLLLNTRSGIYTYNNTTKALEKLSFGPVSNEKPIQRLYTRSNYLCVAYMDKLVVHDTDSGKVWDFKEYNYIDTRNIVYWHNHFWFCTSKGIVTFDCASQSFDKKEEGVFPQGVAIESLVSDNDELLLSIGTGVVKLSEKEPLFQKISIDNQEGNISGVNKVWHICNDGEEIIVSTEKGVKIITEKNEIIDLSSFMNFIPEISFVSNVIRDSENIWVSTFDEGFYHIDLKKKEVQNFSSSQEPPYYINNNSVRHTAQTDEVVYVSTDGGLYEYDKNKRSIEQITLDHSMYATDGETMVTCTFLDTSNNLWVGTQNGLFLKNPEGEVRYFSTTTDLALSHNSVRCIKQFSDSEILVGTSAGLNKVNVSSDAIHYLERKDGLDNDVIYSIEIDSDNDVWIGTNQGISLIDNDLNIINYNIYDGLQASEFNTNASAKDNDGYFYFGGISGISKFNPIDVKNSIDTIRPILTEIEILPHDHIEGLTFSYPLKESYKFENEECNFVIRFSNINFRNPENDEFYYRLDGYDHNWIKVKGNKEVQFMNLNHGDYTFQLRGAAAGGKMYDDIKSIEITIKPPFYKSVGFKLLMLAIFSGLLCFIYWFRIRQIENRNKSLLKVINEQTGKLEKTNELKETFLKQVPEPLVIYNADKEIILSNDLYDELVVSELEANSTQEGLVGFLNEHVFNGIDQLISENLDSLWINLIYKSVYFDLKFNKIKLDSDQYGAAVLIRDMTQIKKAEVILRKNEDLFRSYFEKSPIGIIYVENPGEFIINCNSKFCQIVNMTKEEILKKTMMDITHPDDLDRDSERYLEALINKRNYLLEPNKKLISKDGKTAITETHITFIYDDKGNYQYTFALVNDVTEQRESQKKLIDVKTKLIQSEKLASLGQITAGVAHEINNPVNFIYNGVNNLKRLVSTIQNNDVDDKETVYKDIEQMIAAIDEGAKRTTEIVKSIRMFTKEDVKNMIEYDVIKGIESTLLLLANRQKDRITIHKNYESEDMLVRCYPSQLNQVFMNILINAIESIEGKGTITISAIKSANEARFEIEDTGKGIPLESYSKVFEPFYSTKGAKNGTGLGLSISHSIIEKHRGNISIRPNEPVGTIVSIAIPL